MLVRYRHPMVHMFKHLTPMESSECSTSFMIIVFSMCFASALDWNKKREFQHPGAVVGELLFMTPVAATTRSMEPERSIWNRVRVIAGGGEGVDVYIDSPTGVFVYQISHFLHTLVEYGVWLYYDTGL